MSQEHEEAQYTIVMPLVCTSDNGGPYDNTSFVAGANFEALRQRLESAAKHMTGGFVMEYIYPEMREQCDLLAMHLGYRMETKPWDQYPDEWLLATFTLIGDDEEEEFTSDITT